MGETTDILSLLKDLSAGFPTSLVIRHAMTKERVLRLKTLALESGSCRDPATLCAEAVRVLGLATRALSGYLYNPGRGLARLAVGFQGP